MALYISNGVSAGQKTGDTRRQYTQVVVSRRALTAKSSRLWLPFKENCQRKEKDTTATGKEQLGRKGKVITCS